MGRAGHCGASQVGYQPIIHRLWGGNREHMAITHLCKVLISDVHESYKCSNDQWPRNDFMKKKTQREWSLHFENSQGELHLDLRFATVNLGIGQIFWCKSLKLIITTKVTSSALIFGHGRSWGSEELSEFSRETTGKAELRLNLRHLTPDTCSLFAVTFCYMEMALFL